MPKRTELDVVYAVGIVCDCDNDCCSGYDSVELFASEQTARQFAYNAWGASYLGKKRINTKKPY